MATKPSYPAKQWPIGHKAIGVPFGRTKSVWCNCEQCSNSDKSRIKSSIAFQKCTCGETHKVYYKPHWITECVCKKGNWNIVEEVK